MDVLDEDGEDTNRFVDLLRLIAAALYVAFVIVSLAKDAAEKKFNS